MFKRKKQGQAYEKSEVTTSPKHEKVSKKKVEVVMILEAQSNDPSKSKPQPVHNKL